jgi:hypothetical protein
MNVRILDFLCEIVVFVHGHEPNIACLGRRDRNCGVYSAEWDEIG